MAARASSDEPGAGEGAGRLVAEGRVLKPGRTTIFAEAEVRNSDGTLVAKAIGTVRARQKDKN